MSERKAISMLLIRVFGYIINFNVYTHKFGKFGSLLVGKLDYIF